MYCVYIYIYIYITISQIEFQVTKVLYCYCHYPLLICQSIFLKHILVSYIFLPSTSGTSLSKTIHSCCLGQCRNPIGCRRWRNSHVCSCPLWHHAEAGHSPLHLSQRGCLPSCYGPIGNDHVPSLLPAVVARLCYLLSIEEFQILLY